MINEAGDEAHPSTEQCAGKESSDVAPDIGASSGLANRRMLTSSCQSSSVGMVNRADDDVAHPSTGPFDAKIGATHRC